MADHTPRPHKFLLQLTERERGALEARSQAEGVSMAAILRSGITARVRGAPDGTWERAIELLAQAAEQGSVPAMRALASELRLGHPDARREPAPDSRSDFGLRAA